MKEFRPSPCLQRARWRILSICRREEGDKYRRYRRYPKVEELLITADGGGSNGSRCRLWKTAGSGANSAIG